MKVQDLLNLIKDTPGIEEYDLNLADYFSVPENFFDEDAEEPSEETFQVVSDFPIRAIAVNDETKELRFILKRSDFSTIEQCPDRILQILKEKMG